MARVIRLADKKGRDALVRLESCKNTRQPRSYVDCEGFPVQSRRLVKSTAECTEKALLKRFDEVEKLADALVADDPEIEMSAVGVEILDTERVFVGQDQKPLYSAKVLEVLQDRDGTELEHREPVDVKPTVSRHQPFRITGKTVAHKDFAGRFAVTRTYQVRHTDGLTFDFLYRISREIEKSRDLFHVGAGRLGQDTLIMERNGLPHVGFLHGKTEGDRYRLLLLLSSMEIRKD